MTEFKGDSPAETGIDMGIEMELDAMRVIARILRPMSKDARDRVLRWLVDLYERRLKAAEGI